MEDQIKSLTEQVKTLLDKVADLENKSLSKSDLAEQIKPLSEEISTIKKEMISVKDIKIKVETIRGKEIELYVKSTDKILDIKSKIKEKENIAEGNQTLFLNETLLNDNSTIAESQIKESSNIYLTKTDDDILNFASPQEKRFIVNSLEKQINKKINILLYSARKDGDDANTFHQKCDRVPDLLYLIKTTNDVVFAIYIDKPLLSDGNSRTDSLQMVISPAHNFAATYHCKSGIGAQFHCMQINAPFLSSNCVDIQSCSDFNLPAYSTGNSSYQIKELEVYSLKNSN